EVEEIEQLGLFRRVEGATAAQFADHRHAKQECHADSGQMSMRSSVFAFVEAIGIDHRMGDRKQGCALMVVDDDYVELGSFGLFERLERLRSAIDADRDACTARLQLDQCLARRAIA